MVRSAKRLSSSTWASPRFLLGVAFVLGSAVLGGLLVTAMNDSEQYWAVAHSTTAGRPVRASDPILVEARVPKAAASSLLGADQHPAPDAVWAAELRAGSLVSTASLSSPAEGTQELPVAVAVGGLPTDLAAGDVVDVWVGPGTDDADQGGAEAHRVLAAVRVAATGEPGLDRRTILVELAQAPEPSVVAELASRHVTVVRVA